MVKKIVTYILLVLFISSTFYACRDKTNETSETISTTQIRFVNLSPIPFDFFVKTNDTILFDTPLSYGEMSDFLPISTGNINFVFCEEQDSNIFFNIETSGFLADNDYSFFVMHTNFSENHFILREKSIAKPSFVRFSNQSVFYSFDISTSSLDTSIYEQLTPFPTDSSQATSNLITLPSNTYTFQLYEAVENELLRTIDNIELNEDTIYHVYIGELSQSVITGDDTLDYEITKQAIQDSAYLSFIHAASNVPEFDILAIKTTGDTLFLKENLTFTPPNINNFTSFIPVPSGTYTLQFREAGTPITLLELTDIQLNINEEKTFLIKGLIENQANQAPLEVDIFP